MNANVLLDMQGRPVTWAELKRRNELYYLRRDDEELRLRLQYKLARVSALCSRSLHRQCGGRMANVPGGRGVGALCPCQCHE